MTTDTDPGAAAAAACAETDTALGQLADVVGRLADGQLHLAHRDGGWTVAQVISHLNVCTLIWLGDMERLRHDPDVTFFFREEIGHDVTGYPPPTVDVATRQLASTRRTLATSMTALDPGVLARTVEIPDLGTRTVAEWIPLIAGHLTMHTGQAYEILRDRGAMPAGADQEGA